MKNPVLNDIMEYAASRLSAAYGYCGCTSGDDVAMLDSDDHKGGEIRIQITVKPE